MLDEALKQFADQIMAKAAETNATYTWDPSSRSVFAPENLDEDIKILAPIGTPVRNRIPRVKGIGSAASWKKMTSKLHSNAAGGGTNSTIFFADAGAPNETSQTYSISTAAYKLLGRKVEVGGLANASSNGQPGGSMLEQRERIKINEVMLGEEEAIIGGDSAYSALEFDGLLKQITTYSGTASLLTVSGIGVYCATLFAEGASPDLLLLHSRQKRALADELQGTGSIQRIVADQQGAATGGINLKSIISPVNGSAIDIEVSRYVNNNALLLTTKTEAGEPCMELEDLIPMSRIDVPSSNFSYIRFIVAATVLKLMFEPYQYKIQGLATS